VRKVQAARLSWFDWAQVIAAGILFLVCGVLLAALWFRRCAEKRALLAEIQHDTRRIRDRNRQADAESSDTDEADPNGKHHLRPNRTPKVSDHDPTRHRPDDGGGKHSPGFTEDDYPTTQFRLRWQDDDTVPFVCLVRPYLDYRPKRTDPDKPGVGDWFKE
jgi:hypothetical protein